MKKNTTCFKGMLSHLLIVLTLPGFSSPVTRTGKAIKWSKFSHKVVTTNIIAVTENAESCQQCVMLCLEMQTCVSVFYRQVSRRCQFHDVLFLSPQDGETEEWTNYYSLTTGSCPPDYINARSLGLCYKQHLKRILYNNSVADCASRGEHLIVIDSQEKQDHVKKQITSSSDGMAVSYSIDGSDAVTEGQWVYHDGRPITFFAWDAGYPNNATSYDDYLVASRAHGAFLWRDRMDLITKYYMCEKDE